MKFYKRLLCQRAMLLLLSVVFVCNIFLVGCGDLSNNATANNVESSSQVMSDDMDKAQSLEKIVNETVAVDLEQEVEIDSESETDNVTEASTQKQTETEKIPETATQKVTEEVTEKPTEAAKQVDLKSIIVGNVLYSNREYRGYGRAYIFSADGTGTAGWNTEYETCSSPMGFTYRIEENKLIIRYPDFVVVYADGSKKLISEAYEHIYEYDVANNRFEGHITHVNNSTGEKTEYTEFLSTSKEVE